MNKEELDAMRLAASQNISEPEVETEEPQSEEPKEEGEAPVEPEQETETEVETEDGTTTVEKDPPRVPYSRFESVNEARIRAEEQLKQYEARAEQERLANASAPTEAGLPTYWVKLYGDSDASKEAYALRQQELTDIRENLHETIRKDMVREQNEAEQRTEETVDSWSNQIDDFAAQNKRKFSDADTDGLLDVMDELTPKDEDGNYIVEPINYLERAVELYDLRQEKALASKKQAKQKTAQLTDTKSEGSLITPTKDWTGDWRSKLARMGQ